MAMSRLSCIVDDCAAEVLATQGAMASPVIVLSIHYLQIAIDLSLKHMLIHINQTIIEQILSWS